MDETDVSVWIYSDSQPKDDESRPNRDVRVNGSINDILDNVSITPEYILSVGDQTDAHNAGQSSIEFMDTALSALPWYEQDDRRVAVAGNHERGWYSEFSAIFNTTANPDGNLIERRWGNMVVFGLVPSSSDPNNYQNALDSMETRLQTLEGQNVNVIVLHHHTYKSLVSNCHNRPNLDSPSQSKYSSILDTYGGDPIFVSMSGDIHGRWNDSQTTASKMHKGVLFMNTGVFGGRGTISQGGSCNAGPAGIGESQFMMFDVGDDKVTFRKRQSWLSPSSDGNRSRSPAWYFERDNLVYDDDGAESVNLTVETPHQVRIPEPGIYENTTHALVGENTADGYWRHRGENVSEFVILTPKNESKFILYDVNRSARDIMTFRHVSNGSTTIEIKGLPQATYTMEWSCETIQTSGTLNTSLGQNGKFTISKSRSAVGCIDSQNMTPSTDTPENTSTTDGQPSSFPPELTTIEKAIGGGTVCIFCWILLARKIL
jgi:hypothetical protein